MPRSDNDPVDLTGVLTALATIVPVNTALYTANPTQAPFINDWTSILQGQATFPALVLTSGQETGRRLEWRTWQNVVMVFLHYIDRFDRGNRSVSQVWSDLDADIKLMRSNIEDNPTLTVAGVPHVSNVMRLELAQYAGQKETATPFPTARRMLTAQFRLLPYISAA